MNNEEECTKDLSPMGVMARWGKPEITVVGINMPRRKSVQDTPNPTGVTESKPKGPMAVLLSE